MSRPADEASILEPGTSGTEVIVTGYLIIIGGDAAGGFSSYAPDLPVSLLPPAPTKSA